MKITAKTQMKIRSKTLSEFKNVIDNAHFKVKAIATLCDKKHSVVSRQMNIGSYVEAYALCESNGIKMISYQAIYDEPPKEVHLETKWEYYR